ncbi:BPTI/Kunitz domain-containing protein-like [Ornithodoros turicata]|uniref:BPTI/Kunitz domain-containing protein-like n=1 Tax=Ornithodoros turicata TaxID=34597 RepID=UPI003139AC1B
MKHFMMIVCFFIAFLNLWDARKAGVQAKSRTNVELCKLLHTQAGKACKARIPMYTYNATLGHCEGFFYGGCHGTANRFKTLEECVRRCPTRSGVNVCSLPRTSQQVNEGICSLWFFVHNYNSQNGRCERFMSPSCFRTVNSFKTEADCKDRCHSSLSRRS